jgi:hypothetical protein
MALEHRENRVVGGGERQASRAHPPVPLVGTGRDQQLDDVRAPGGNPGLERGHDHRAVAQHTLAHRAAFIRVFPVAQQSRDRAGRRPPTC